MDDVINRQAAINALENTECELLPEEWDELTDAIMNVPSAQPEPQWIPCNERLPEHYDWYLVSNKETSWIALWKDGVFLSVSGYFEFNDIIAWMPLPEPYRKDGE